MRNKILIVDDVDINREILRSILEDEYTILEAENGKQALEIVDQEAKDMAAIMLDLVMPEMDGTQVLEELNRREVIGNFYIFQKVLDNPSSNYRIIWYNQNRNNRINPSTKEIHFDFPKDLNAPTGLFLVIRPIADSAIIIV